MIEIEFQDYPPEDTTFEVCGPIVKTIPTTKMLNKLAKQYNVPVCEIGVGLK